MSPKFLTLTEVLEFHFAAALTFLELNAYPVLGGEDELEAATKKVAAGKLDKNGAAAVLEKIYNEHKAA